MRDGICRAGKGSYAGQMRDCIYQTDEVALLQVPVVASIYVQGLKQRQWGFVVSCQEHPPMGVVEIYIFRTVEVPGIVVIQAAVVSKQ